MNESKGGSRPVVVMGLMATIVSLVGSWALIGIILERRLAAVPQPVTEIPQEFLRPVMPVAEDQLGVPLIRLDQREIIADLLAGRFEALERRFQDLEAQARRDPRFEFHLLAAHNAFRRIDGATGRALDRWVQARVDSPTARLSRARYRLMLAYYGRGTKTTRETSRDQFAAMNRYVDLTMADLEAVRTLDDSSPLFWSMTLLVLQLRQSSYAMAEALDQASRRQPASLLWRISAMKSASPRWGGSYRLMRKIADDAQAHLDENPLLAVLRGFPSDVRGVTARQRNSFGRASKFNAQALEHGHYPAFLVNRARGSFFSADYLAALSDLRTVAATRPQDRDVLELKGWTQFYLATVAPDSLRETLLELSHADLALLDELLPGDSEVEQWRERVRVRLTQCRAALTDC